NADIANERIILHLSDARYEQHDNPGDLSKIRQGISMGEGDFPITLHDLNEKNRKRRGVTQMTLNELMQNKSGSDVAQRTAIRTEVNKRFSFALASFAFALVGVPLAITAHRK